MLASGINHLQRELPLIEQHTLQNDSEAKQAGNCAT